MLQSHILTYFFIIYFIHLSTFDEGKNYENPRYEVSPTYCCLETPVFLYITQCMLVYKHQHQSFGTACYHCMQSGLQGVLSEDLDRKVFRIVDGYSTIYMI
jgi:hypothetical protein